MIIAIFLRRFAALSGSLGFNSRGLGAVISVFVRIPNVIIFVFFVLTAALRAAFSHAVDDNSFEHARWIEGAPCAWTLLLFASIVLLFL